MDIREFFTSPFILLFWFVLPLLVLSLLVHLNRTIGHHHHHLNLKRAHFVKSKKHYHSPLTEHEWLNS